MWLLGSTDLQKEGSGVDLQMVPEETGVFRGSSAKDGELRKERTRMRENKSFLEEVIVVDKGNLSFWSVNDWFS